MFLSMEFAMTMRSFFWPVIASMALTAFSAHAQHSSELCVRVDRGVNLPGMNCPASPSGSNQDSTGASTAPTQRLLTQVSSLPFTGGGGGALGLVDGRATGIQMGRFPGCRWWMAEHGVVAGQFWQSGHEGGWRWVCHRRVTFPRPFIGTPTVIPIDPQFSVISVTPTHFDASQTAPMVGGAWIAFMR